jgi:hypothetical protein
MEVRRGYSQAMFTVQESAIDLVRRRLDTFGELRSTTGLTPTEGRQYQELCAMEKVLLTRIHRNEPDRKMTSTLGLQGRMRRVGSQVVERSRIRRPEESAA